MQVLLDYINELNWLAVLVATLAAFAVGAIWYTPALFGNVWMKSIGLTKKDTEKANMGKAIGLTILSTFIAATAMGVLVVALALTTAMQGASLGILVAVGLLATNKLMQAQFELRPLTYNIVTSASDVVALGAMAAILAVWR